jgi:hypothetical protein
VLTGLLIATATPIATLAAVQPTPRAVAVARARIVHAARISFSAPPPRPAKGRRGLIEFQ